MEQNEHPLAQIRRMGLSLKELHSAMKVIEKLRYSPDLFKKDLVLQETKLWLMISRPKHLRKRWKQVTNHVKKQRKKRLRKHDKGKKYMMSELFVRKKQDHAKAMAITGDPSQRLMLTGGAEVKTEEPVEEDPVLRRPQTCYVCGEPYVALHHFYHMLCRDCGDFNYTKRLLRKDLTGKVVIVTGGRIKIGYQIVLKLLRDGATVVATTRFTSDAYERYSAEPDFDQWKERLVLLGLDLKCMNSIRRFSGFILATYGEGGVYALVNNAAQTIARPREYFEELYRKESKMLEWNKEGLSMLTFESSNTTTTVANVPPQSENMYDTQQEYLDNRVKNTWTTRLHEVSLDELVDVFSVNSIAPFALITHLTPALKGSLTTPHHVINVSAMEGVFYKPFKSINHPHTNMAKASLNMLTRTSGQHYAQKYNILMNAVDTGWVTDENPKNLKLRNIAKNLVAPLDEIDGAARVLDPIYAGTDIHSRFWKDYKVSVW
eukprot:TRINITY_DN2914_c0_g1_i1.p1 TRINITY_DN2914_c0_g1~~TRINITY_DN2914_c0_g1_i1.p1  ORF type:complete len:490 (+),score=107.13 TRINITY_DN2914_c0_g1_i1:49-1518(+)